MKILSFIALFLIISNCSIKNMSRSHGIKNLEKKSKNLVLNETNKNDIYNVLGPPSTKSHVDENTWIYIERKIENSSIIKLGKEKVVRNNLLVLLIDQKGILHSKQFYDLTKMNNVQISDLQTSDTFRKNTFLSNFLTSVRQKINDPIKNRIKKNRK